MTPKLAALNIPKQLQKDWKENEARWIIALDISNHVEKKMSPPVMHGQQSPCHNFLSSGSALIRPKAEPFQLSQQKTNARKSVSLSASTAGTIDPHRGWELG